MAFANRRNYGAGGSDVLTRFVFGEVPDGTINGTNKVFTLANSVLGNAIDVFLNGLIQKGGGEDYTLSDGNTITFVVAPPTGSILFVDYIKQ